MSKNVRISGNYGAVSPPSGSGDLELTAATQPPIGCSYLPEPLGGVAVLTLNRPDSRNSLGPLEWQLLGEQLNHIAAEDRVRVVILRGAANNFCTGSDIRTIADQLERSAPDLQQRLYQDAQVIRQLYELDRPVIAQIQGACAGAGLALALACDVRLCSPSAAFAAPAHRLGMTADYGLMWLLPQIIGVARATELLMVGDPVQAARAETIGLVHRVVPDDKINEEVQTLAARLATGPRVAQAMTKRGLRRALASDFASMLDWESQAQSILSRTDDAREGVRSILDKRKANFRGR